MIFGIETELGIAPQRHDLASDKRGLAHQIVVNVKDVLKAVPGSHTGLAGGDFWIENGSRVYGDGEYVEIATAEVQTPHEVLAYQRANELTLLRCLEATAKKRRFDVTDVRLVRSCTDYAGHYRGFHLNLLTRQSGAADLVEHLVPFLVTRFYAVAGGIGPRGLVMSQKNEAIRCVSSTDTREKRPIVNLKQESLAGSSYKRLHLTHSDMCMSELGTYLTIGCTALVVKMLDDGACVGPVYKLEDPVNALQLVDSDFWGTAPLPLASGLTATPLEIQEHYLRAVERYTAKRQEPWVREVVQQWRWVLETLRSGGPDGLDRCLDPYIKRRLYAAHLQRRGCCLETLGRWCSPVSCVKPFWADGPRHRDVRGWLRDTIPAVRFEFLSERMAQARLDWSDLPAAVRLCNEVTAMDLAYHDISGNGLYFRLRDAQVIDSRMVNDSQIMQATTSPPPNTRAAARGRAIVEAGCDDGVQANWTFVRSKTRCVQLPDPFSTRLTWDETKTKVKS